MKKNSSSNDLNLTSGTPASVNDISVTASSFETKIKKRLEEQSSTTQLAQQKASDNRVLVLQTMNAIRRAFNGVVAIDLGTRFSLDLEIDDLNGWPRLELCLIDNQLPNDISEKLTACVQTQTHDLLVELRSSGARVVCNLEIPGPKHSDPGLIIKKCIRLFLDELEDYILNPKAPDLAPLESEEDQAEACVAVKGLKETELFNDDLQVGNSNLITAESDDDLSINLDK